MVKNSSGRAAGTTASSTHTYVYFVLGSPSEIMIPKFRFTSFKYSKVTMFQRNTLVFCKNVSFCKNYISHLYLFCTCSVYHTNFSVQVRMCAKYLSFIHLKNYIYLKVKMFQLIYCNISVLYITNILIKRIFVNIFKI